MHVCSCATKTQTKKRLPGSTPLVEVHRKGPPPDQCTCTGMRTNRLDLDLSSPPLASSHFRLVLLLLPNQTRTLSEAGWSDKAHTELQPPRPNRRLSASPSRRHRRRRRSRKNANTPFFPLFFWRVPSPRSPSLHLADPNCGGNPEPISPAFACTCAGLSELHVHTENSPLCL